MLFVRTRTDHTFAHANLDILEMDATVQVKLNNLKSLHIRFDYYNEFLFVVVVVIVFFKARKKRLEHERSVERNTRRSREAYASLLMLW